MVRQLFFLVILVLPATGFSQRLQIGLKENFSLLRNLETNATSYYFAIPGEGYYARVSDVDSKTNPAIELFVRYDYFNGYFIQGGLMGQKTNYTITRESPHTNKPYKIQSISIQDYLVIGKVLKQNSTIKPYVSLGITTDFFLGYSNAYQYTSGNASWEKDEIIINDLENRLNTMTLSLRLAVGIRYYALHTELIAGRNLTSLESSSDPFHESLSTLQLSVGYNILSFNTIKKSN